MIHSNKDPWEPKAKAHTLAFNDALRAASASNPIASLEPLHYGTVRIGKDGKTKSGSGFTTHDIFVNMVRQFVPHMRVGVPDNEFVVLMFDGAGTHVNVEFLYELYFEHKVHVVLFPPHLTKYYMPNDARFWHGNFKRYLRRKLIACSGSEGVVDWMGKLGRAVGKAMTSHCAKRSFEHVGMVVDETVHAEARRAAETKIRQLITADEEVTRLASNHPNLMSILRPEVLIFTAKSREKARKKKAEKMAKSTKLADIYGWTTRNHNISILKRVIAQKPSSAAPAARSKVVPRVGKRARRSAGGNSLRQRTTTSHKKRKVGKTKSLKKTSRLPAPSESRRRLNGHSEYIVQLPRTLGVQHGSARHLRHVAKFFKQ